LIFVIFLVTAGLVGLVSQQEKQYQLKPSSLTTLITTFVFTVIFIVGIGLIILDGQRYVADVAYAHGLALWEAKQYDSAIKNVETAASLNNSSDLYFRQLSQMYLISLQIELSN